MKNTIYIIGVGRSGTSLLMTLLNGHSQIAFTPETHFLRFYLGTDAIKQAVESKGVQAFQEILEKDDYFKRLNIEASVLLEPYLEGKKIFDLQQVYRDVLEIYLNKKGKNYIGDKDPRYIDFQEAVKGVYPNSKIIHIYRDPRDVVLSKTKADWSSHRPYWLNAIISQVQIERGRRKAERLFGDNFYELSYESLLTQPNETLTNLLTFLDLNFEESMIDLTQSAQELVDASEIQWKDNTFKPLLGGNTEKWRTKLTSTQIRATEIICKEWFEELGYTYSNPKIGFLKEVFLKVAFGFRGLQRKLYDRKFEAQLKELEKMMK